MVEEGAGVPQGSLRGVAAPLQIGCLAGDIHLGDDLGRPLILGLNGVDIENLDFDLVAFLIFPVFPAGRE